MSGVKIEHSPELGNVLIATQAFEPGQAVVNEVPLLHVPQLKPSNPLYRPLQVNMVFTKGFKGVQRGLQAAEVACACTAVGAA